MPAKPELLKDPMRQKNVLVLIEHFGQGGAEKVAAMLAQILHESGRFRVWFYAVHQPAHLPLLEGIGTGSLGIKTHSDLATKTVNYYKKVKRLKKIKNNLNVDITISSLWPADWINALTGEDKKIAVGQINILNNPQNAAMVRYRRLVTWIYKRFDRVVLGSSTLTDELSGYFKINPGKLQVIHNPIDTLLIEHNMQIEPLNKLDALLAKYNICVVANRLHPIKNNTVLVHIYKILSDQSEVKFLIIGEGEEKEIIQTLIGQEGLRWSQVDQESFDETAHFYFLNFQGNIHNIISRSRMFLFPTKAEGLPLALLEAMYCGVPIVASDCPNGGISEVVEAKHPYNASQPRTQPEELSGGYLMPIPASEKKETIKIWAERIKEILNADKFFLESIRSANRQRARNFDKQIIGMKWQQLLDEVCNEK